MFAQAVDIELCMNEGMECTNQEDAPSGQTACRWVKKTWQIDIDINDINNEHDDDNEANWTWQIEIGRNAKLHLESSGRNTPPTSFMQSLKQDTR